MILSYLNPSKSKLSFTQVPIAVINAFTSLFAIIFWINACSVFKILPLNGKIAWKLLSRHCFALPHAESPSTIYNSVPSLLFLAQSANFPGSTPHAKIFFLKTVSLANFAANLALAASSTFWNILSNSHSLFTK
jgi:hypothetical protein